MNTLSKLFVAVSLTAISTTAAVAGSTLQAVESATDGLYEPMSTSGGAVDSNASRAALLHVEAATDGLYEAVPTGMRRVSIASMEVRHVYSSTTDNSSLEAVRVNLQDIDD